jgi:hypothetical protein
MKCQALGWIFLARILGLWVRLNTGKVNMSLMGALEATAILRMKRFIRNDTPQKPICRVN